MRIEEFAPEKAWWDSSVENEFSWKVKAEYVIASNYNFDVKNPNTVENDHGDPEELLEKYRALIGKISNIRTEFKKELINAFNHK